MILEARPSLVDFHVAAALDSFPVLWVLPIGLLLVASAYWDLSFLPGFLLAFSGSWDLRFLLGLFLVVLRLEIFIFLLGFLKVFRNS